MRSGSRGSFSRMLRELKPKSPASRKTIIAFVFEFFSVYIRRIEIQINAQPIILLRSGYAFGTNRKKMGMTMSRERTAIVEPMRVNFTA